MSFHWKNEKPTNFANKKAKNLRDGEIKILKIRKTISQNPYNKVTGCKTVCLYVCTEGSR